MGTGDTKHSEPDQHEERHERNPGEWKWNGTNQGQGCLRNFISSVHLNQGGGGGVIKTVYPAVCPCLTISLLERQGGVVRDPSVLKKCGEGTRARRENAERLTDGKRRQEKRRAKMADLC